jgi:hypothetical protein
MRAYLSKKATIIKIETPVVRHYLNREGGPKVCEYAEGSPYIDLTSRQADTGIVPEEIDSVTEEYSLHVKHYGGGTGTHREVGLYQLGGATATVDRNEHCYHFIDVRGKKAADVVTLANRIVAGDIAPVKSHERGQVKAGMPGLREAAHQLIEAAFRAFDRWRLA